MLAMPISGITGSLFSKYQLKVFGIELPKFFQYDPLIKEIMTVTHQSTAYLFLIIICVHILAAIKHLLVDCDGVFERMMPAFSKNAPKSEEKKAS